MSYSPSTMSDDNKPPPDPRYLEWDKRSRKELGLRLYEAVDKRRNATEELIPRVMKQVLDILDLNINHINNNNICLLYRISAETVIKLTHESIDRQIRDWKGLRWWRFNENNACDSWNKWFKKAKCWQDQNQYKPLGRFWCLIFDELQQYTLDIAQAVYPSNSRPIQQCLYSKCIEAILKGQVRFERTRETPLLPVRALTQSKELQLKLQKIDNGFTLSNWKNEAEKAHKRQKQIHSGRENIKSRANVATILNERCSKHATNVYRKYVKLLKQIIPSLNIDFAAIENENNGRYGMHHKDEISMTNQISIPIPTTTRTRMNRMDRMDRMERIESINNGYGPSRGGSSSILRVESQRYSPTLSSNSASDISSLSDAVSVGSRSSARSEHSHHHHNNNRHYHHNHNNHNNNNQRRIHSMPPKPPTPMPSSENTSKLDRLSDENEKLKAELAAIKQQLFYKQTSNNDVMQTLVQQMTMQNEFNKMMTQKLQFNRMMTPNIPSPMTVPMPPNIPSSILVNDINGGHGIYNPPNGNLIYFPTKASMEYNAHNNNNNTNTNRIPPNTINFDRIINETNMNIDIAPTPSIPPIPSTTTTTTDIDSSDNNNINNNNNPSLSTPGISTTNCFGPSSTSYPPQEMSPFTPTPYYDDYNYDNHTQYGEYDQFPLRVRESAFDNTSFCEPQNIHLL